MRIKKRHIWLIVILVGAVLYVSVQVARDIFREEERQVRSDIRKAIKDAYPEEVKQLSTAYGLEPFVLPDASPAETTPKTSVVLIHGLDDPGKVWMNLAPTLAKDEP